MLPKQSFVIKNLTDLEKLADLLLPHLRPDTFLLLQGSLGAGKTTFAQIIARRLGIKQAVNSPTFTLCQQYKIKDDYYLNHFDFFRLSSADNICFFLELTINNLNIIEWPEKNPQFWQDKRYIYLVLRIISQQQIRVIELK
jgi:tRNA threonylcarbamoyladenosine biosynthesis protein TsaE